jgi:drug/metabolite transporter, DME family
MPGPIFYLKTNAMAHLFVLAGAVLWGTTGTAQALAQQARSRWRLARCADCGGNLLAACCSASARAPALAGCKNAALARYSAGAACMAAYQVLFFAGVR